MLSDFRVFLLKGTKAKPLLGLRCRSLTTSHGPFATPRLPSSKASFPNIDFKHGCSSLLTLDVHVSFIVAYCEVYCEKNKSPALKFKNKV